MTIRLGFWKGETYQMTQAKAEDRMKRKILSWQPKSFLNMEECPEGGEDDGFEKE